MNFLKDNNISKYNYKTKFYIKLCICKCHIINKFNIINYNCIKCKLYDYNKNQINKLIEYCQNNNFKQIDKELYICKYNNKYKINVINDETLYLKKELLNGKLYNNNLLYCEISTPINFYEIPNIIFDETLQQRTLFIREYIEIEKDILDNKLIENPKLILIKNNNQIQIQLDLCNNKNNYKISDNILNDLINIFNILNINISKDDILNYINNVKKVCL